DQQARGDDPPRRAKRLSIAAHRAPRLRAGDRTSGVVRHRRGAARRRTCEEGVSGDVTMKNKVSDWMTQQPVTIDDHASIIEAIHLMSEKNVRRLPVMHHGRLA